MSNTEHSFDFLHYLQDTVTLLGGRVEIRKLIEKAMDNAIIESDVDTLRNFNIELITSVKDRLANIHTMKIKGANE